MLIDGQRKFVATHAASALISVRIIRNDVLSRFAPEFRADTSWRCSSPLDPPRGLDDGPWLVPLGICVGFFRLRSRYDPGQGIRSSTTPRRIAASIY